MLDKEVEKKGFRKMKQKTCTYCDYNCTFFVIGLMEKPDCCGMVTYPDRMATSTSIVGCGWRVTTGACKVVDCYDE